MVGTGPKMERRSSNGPLGNLASARERIPPEELFSLAKPVTPSLFHHGFIPHQACPPPGDIRLCCHGGTLVLSGYDMDGSSRRCGSVLGLLGLGGAALV